ncbi:MAG TPA: hypothetical protein PLH23_05000 [Hyphomonadaceae bacterium]|nr:hypothetical protein [Hyphomonadaceae bacterium]
MIRKLIVGLAAFALCTFGAAAQSTDEVPPRCVAERAELDKINAKYDQLYADLDDEEIPEGDISVYGDVKWTTQELIFGVPTVTMRNRKIAFNTPQVTMVNKEISTKIPRTELVRRKVGQKPEVVCKNWKCKIRWKNIYAKIPEVTMELKVIKIGIPEFTYKATEVVFKVPEFKNVQRRFVFKYPEFTGEPGSASTERRKRFEALADAHGKEAAPALAALLACEHGALLIDRKMVHEQFDFGIKQISASIEAMTAAGIDATKLEGDDGESINLPAQLDNLIRERDAALVQIDDALAKMLEARSNALKAIGVAEETEA